MSEDGLTPQSKTGAGRSERAVAFFASGVILLYALWSLQTPGPAPEARPVRGAVPSGSLTPEQVPLVTGDEPLVDIFTKAGCPVCHTIPGIPGAHGRVGPVLSLGATGSQRLQDPAYAGSAQTVREYIVESVVDPSRYVVPGYPDQTMPTWYGAKLSALALEKIAQYLERQADEPTAP
jgi:hypothetical protein